MLYNKSGYHRLDPDTLAAVREEVRRELEREERRRRAGAGLRSRYRVDEDDLLGYLPPRLRASVRRRVRDDLRRERDLRQRMDETEDPFVYCALEVLLAEAQDQGMTIRELMERLPEISRVGQGTLQHRLQGYLRSEQGKSFLLGVAAAVLVLALAPAAQKNLRPLAVKLMQELTMLAEQFGASLDQAKEGLQDLLAEAQFTRAKAAVQKAIDEAEGVPASGA